MHEGLRRSSLEATLKSHLPTRVGRYELVTELSTGPLGPVWAARVAEGAEQGRIVAVRRIPLAPGDNRARQLLLTSGAAATAIRDSKIAAVLDVVPAPDEVCVVSEYVDGEPLHMLMESAVTGRSPLPVPVALAITVDALGAVRALRRRWIERLGQGEEVLERYLHGALCPAALVVATFGDTMLTEPLLWGTAASVQGFGPRARMSAYFAPELLEGEGRADERSDVYSAGVILWELLANRSLFKQPRTGKAPIPSLDDVERHGAPVPSQVKEIVARALDDDPAKRFPTVDALVATLRSLPRDSIGSSEQLMVALDRLARKSLEARRALVASAGGRFDSAPPESSRVTAKPPPPKALGQFEPAPLIMNRAPDPASFGEHEAPTLSQAKLPPRPPRRPSPPAVEARAPVAGIPPPPAILLLAEAGPPPEVAPVVAAGPPPEVAPVVEVETSSEIAAVAEPASQALEAPALDLRSPEASALPVDETASVELYRRRARGRKIVGFAVGGAALTLVLALVVGRKPDPVDAGPAVSAPPPGPAPVRRPALPSATVAAPAPPASAEQDTADAAAGAEPSAAPAASATPDVHRQPVERARPKHKPFRPTGI